VLYRRSDSKHILLEWASNEQAKPREEEEDVLRRRWGEGTGGGGDGRAGEKEVLSLRSMISTCPCLDVNTNRKRELFKVAPFVHNALAVGYSLVRRQSWTGSGRERERANRADDQRAVTFTLGDDQIEAPPPDGIQLNRVENSSGLAASDL